MDKFIFYLGWYHVSDTWLLVEHLLMNRIANNAEHVWTANMSWLILDCTGHISVSSSLQQGKGYLYDCLKFLYLSFFT